MVFLRTWGLDRKGCFCNVSGEYIGWDWTWSTVWPQINTAFAEYNVFGVMSENNKYELIFDSYSGKSLSFVINGGSVNIVKDSLLLRSSQHHLPKNETSFTPIP